MDTVPIAATKPTGNKRGPKRTGLERAIDLAEIENLSLRGLEHAAIAAEIGKKRRYSLSRQMITHELQRLARLWESAALESFDQQRAKVLRQLSLAESQGWLGWERSQGQKGEPGNPAFLRIVLDSLAQRCRLAGLDSPQRTEISGPAGGPVMLEATGQQAPLDPQQRIELLRRHLARMEEQQRPQAEKAEPTEAKPALAG